MIQFIVLLATVAVVTGTSIISSVSPANRPGTGSTSITILGNGFATASSLTSKARFGDSAAESSLWISSSSLVAKFGSSCTPPLQVDVILTSSSKSTLTNSITSNFGMISSQVRSNAPISGSSSLTLLATPFFCANMSPSARLGRTAGLTSLWISVSTIRVKGSTGVDAGAPAIMTVDLDSNFISTLTNVLSFDILTVSSAVTTNAPTTGSVSVTLAGSSVGAVDLSARVRVGGTRLVGTVWVSSSTVRGKVGLGTETGLSVAATSGQTRSSLSKAVSYAGVSLTLSSAVTTNAPTTGSVSVTLAGSSVGAVDLSARVRVGGSGLVGTVWVSSSTVRGKVGLGTETGLSVAATSGQTRSSLSKAVSYAGVSLTLSSAVKVNSAATGATQVTVLMGNVGAVNLSPRWRVGGTAPFSTLWISSSGISAKNPPGVNLRPTVFASYSGQVRQWATLSSVVTFDQLESNSAAVRTNLPVTGSSSTTVLGSHFSLAGYSVRAAFGRTASSTSAWVSSSALGCKILRGSGGSVTLVTTVSKLVSSSSLALSFDLISFTNSIVSNAPSTSGISVTVFGSGANLGSSISSRVRIQRTTASASIWTSDSSLSTKVISGSVRMPTVIATTSLRPGSVTLTLTFNSAELSSFIVQNALTTSAVSITVIGQRLGNEQYSAAAKTANTAVTAKQWVSDSAMSIKPSFGRGSGHSILSTIAVLAIRTHTKVLSYMDWFVSSSVMSNYQSSGATSVTMLGTRLGWLEMYTMSGRIKRSGIDASFWVSESSLRGKFSQGVRTSHLAVVTGDTVIKSITLSLTTDTPAPSATLPTNTPATSSFSVTVLARSAGQADHTILFRFSQTASSASLWVSTSAVRSKPASFASPLVLQFPLTLSTLETLSHTLSFNRPTVSNIARWNVPSTASVQVTLLGAGSATKDPTARSRILQTASALTAWVSDSAINSKSPAGSRATKCWPLQVTVFSPPVYTLTAQYSFDVPAVLSSISTSEFVTVVTSTSSIVNGVQQTIQTSTNVLVTIVTVSTRNTPRTSSVSVTLTGRDFKQTQASSMIRVGVSGAMATVWISETAVSSKAHRGLERKIPHQITLAEDSSPLPPNRNCLTNSFSFDREETSSIIRTNVPASGSVSVSILVMNYPSIGHTSAIAHKGSTCAVSLWISSTSLRAKTLSGVGTSAQLVSTLIFQSWYPYSSFSTALTFARSEPCSTVTPGNIPSTSSVSVTVLGSSYGKEMYSQSARFSKSAQMTLEWASSSSITSKSAAGGSRNLSLLSSAGDRTSSASMVFTFSVGLSSSVRLNVPATSSVSATVLGLSFATRSDFSSYIRFGFTSHACSKWLSVSSIMTKSSFGRRSQLGLPASIAQVVGCLTAAATFDGAAVSSISPCNAAVTGSSTVTLVSRNVHESTQRTVLGGTANRAHIWISGSSLGLKLAHGRCISRDFSITTISLPPTTLTASFTFVDPLPMTKITLQSSVTSTVDNNGQQVTTTLVQTVDYFTGSNVPATGAVAASIYGAQLQGQYSAVMRFGSGSNSEWTFWRSETIIRVKLPSGAFRNIGVVVTSCEVEASVSSAFSFNTVTPSSIIFTNMPLTAATACTVLGIGMGSTRDVSRRLRFGLTTVDSSAWFSQSSLSCKRAAGAGTGIFVALTGWGLTSQLASSTLTRASTYDQVVLSSAVMTNTPTTASASVTLVATATSPRFGDHSRPLRFGLSATSATVWRADTATRTKSSPALNGKSTVVATGWSALQSSLSVVISQDQGYISSLLKQNLPSTGAVSVTVCGKRFGTSNVPTKAFRSIQLSSAAALLWRSETAILAKVAAGRGRTSSVVATAHSILTATLTNAGTFDMVVLSSFVSTNAAPTGAVTATVLGRCVGASSSSFFSIRMAIRNTKTEASVWRADSSVTLRRAAGAVISGQVSATAWSAVSTITLQTTFDQVVLSGSIVSNGATTGSRSVTLLAFSGISSVRASSNTYSIGGTCTAASIWVSETATMTKSVPSEQPYKVIVATGSAARLSSLSRAFTFLSAFVSSPIARNSAATGSFSVTVMGVYFGTSDWSRTVAVSGTLATASVWVADSSMTAKRSAGSGLNLAVATTTSGPVPSAAVASFSRSLTFDRACLSRSVVTNAAATGSRSITMLAVGELSCAGDLSVRSSVGATPTMATIWVSDSSFVAKIGGGGIGWLAASSRSLAVSVARSTISTLSLALSQDRIFLSSGVFTNIALTGSVTCTIFSRDLSPIDTTVRARYGHGTGLAVSIWKSESAVQTKFASSSRGGSSLSQGVTLGKYRPTLTSSVTHDALLLSSSLVTNSRATGAVSVSVMASNLGSLAAASANARFDFVSPTAFMATKWLADSSLQCKLSLGTSTSHGVVASGSALRFASLSSSWTYNSGVVSTVTRTNCATTGAQSLTISGTNFGLVDWSLIAAVTGALGSQVEATIWIADSALVIKRGAGVGNSLAVVVTGWGPIPFTVRTSLSRASTFDHLRLSTSIVSNAACTGSRMLTLLSVGGMSLLSDTSLKVRLGGTGPTATFWFSDTTTRVKVPSSENVAVGLSSSVFFGVSRSTLSAAVTFDNLLVEIRPTEFSSGRKFNLATTGSMSATIVGRDFGTRQQTSSTTFQASASQAFGWASDSALRMKTLASFGVGLGVRLSHVPAVGATLTLLLTSDTTLISAITRTNIATTSAVCITLLMSNAGIDGRSVGLGARNGGTSVETSMWVSGTAVPCKASKGRSVSMRTGITLADIRRSSTITQAVSYDSNSVTGLAARSASNSPSSGATSVSIVGTSFNKDYGRASSALVLGSTSHLAVLWRSMTTAHVKTPGSAIQMVANVVVTVMNFQLSTAQNAWSQNAPTIRRVGAALNIPTTGSVTTTITGIDFRPRIGTVASVLRGSVMVSSLWVSESSIRSKLVSVRVTSSQSLGITLDAYVQRGKTLTLSHSFDGMVPLSRVVSNGPATASFSVTLSGTGAAIYPSSSRVSFDGTGAVSSLWISDSSLRAKLASSTKSKFGFASSVSAQLRIPTFTGAFTIDNTLVSAAVATNVAPTGSKFVTILGGNMGVVGATVGVFLGNSAACIMPWFSESSIRAKSPASPIQIMQSLSWTLGRRMATLSAALTIDGPLAAASGLAVGSVSNVRTTGAVSVSLVGSGLAALSSWSSISSLDKTVSLATLWVADSSVSCRSPSGVVLGSKYLAISVQRGAFDRLATLTRALTYDSLVVSGIVTINSPDTGAVSVTVVGSSVLGMSVSGGTSLNAALGGSNTDSSLWVSGSALSLKTPVRFSNALGVVAATVALVGRSTASRSLSFNFPLPSSVIRVNVATTGASSVTLVGSQMSFHPSPAVRLLGSSSEACSWVSDTSVPSKSSLISGNSRVLALSILTRISPAATLTAALTMSQLRLLRFIANLPATGSFSVTLSGSVGTLLNVDSSVVSRTGRSSAQVTAWVSSTSAAVKLSRGLQAFSLSCAVTLETFRAANNTARTRNTLTRQVTYNQVVVAYPPITCPFISCLPPWGTNAPGTGATSITTSGINLASTMWTAVKMVGSTSCEASQWIAESAVRCKVSTAKPLQSGLPVIASAQAQRKSLSLVFSYFSRSALDVHAVLDDSLVGIGVSFNFDTNMATLSTAQQFSCKFILPTQSVSLLGDGPSCSWNNASYLIIQFGTSATVTLSDSLVVGGGSLPLRYANEPGDVLPLSLALPIEPASNPIKLLMTMNVPRYVSACDDSVLFLANVLSGGGGRSVTMSWVITPTPVSGSAAVVGNSQMRLLTSGMTSGIDYTVKATARDFVGTEVSSSKQVTKVVGSILPKVAILGSDFLSVHPSVSVLVTADISVSSCANQNIDPTTLGVSIIWFVNSTTPISNFTAHPIFATAAATTSRSIRIPGAQLVGGFTYRLTVRTCLTLTPSVCASASVNATRLQPALSVKINGGSRVVPSAQSLTLVTDVLEGLPFVGGLSGIKFQWSCLSAVSSSRTANCSFTTQNFAATNSTFRTVLPSSAITSGTFYFTVTATRVSDGSVSSDTITIQALSALSSQNILALSLSGNRRFPASGTLDLTVNANGTINKGATYKWAVTAKTTAGVDGDTVQMVSYASPYFTLDGRTLVAGTTYSVRCALLSPSGAEVSWVSTTVSVNAPPTVADCSILPSSGVALQTEFELNCDKFSDDPDDYPLQFYWMQVKGLTAAMWSQIDSFPQNNQSAFQSWVDYLLDNDATISANPLTQRSQTARALVLLPPASDSANNRLLLLAAVGDVWGAFVRKPLIAPVKIDSLGFNTTSAALQFGDATRSQDLSRMLQVASATGIAWSASNQTATSASKISEFVSSALTMNQGLQSALSKGDVSEQVIASSFAAGAVLIPPKDVQNSASGISLLKSAVDLTQAISNKAAQMQRTSGGTFDQSNLLGPAANAVGAALSVISNINGAASSSSSNTTSTPTTKASDVQELAQKSIATLVQAASITMTQQTASGVPLLAQTKDGLAVVGVKLTQSQLSNSSIGGSLNFKPGPSFAGGLDASSDASVVIIGLPSAVDPYGNMDKPKNGSQTSDSYTLALLDSKGVDKTPQSLSSPVVMRPGKSSTANTQRRILLQATATGQVEICAAQSSGQWSNLGCIVSATDGSSYVECTCHTASTHSTFSANISPDLVTAAGRGLSSLKSRPTYWQVVIVSVLATLAGCWLLGTVTLAILDALEMSDFQEDPTNFIFKRVPAARTQRLMMENGSLLMQIFDSIRRHCFFCKMRLVAPYSSLSRPQLLATMVTFILVAISAAAAMHSVKSITGADTVSIGILCAIIALPIHVLLPLMFAKSRRAIHEAALKLDKQRLYTQTVTAVEVSADDQTEISISGLDSNGTAAALESSKEAHAQSSEAADVFMKWMSARKVGMAWRARARQTRSQGLKRAWNFSSLETAMERLNPYATAIEYKLQTHVSFFVHAIVLAVCAFFFWVTLVFSYAFDSEMAHNWLISCAVAILTHLMIVEPLTALVGVAMMRARRRVDAKIFDPAEASSGDAVDMGLSKAISLVETSPEVFAALRPQAQHHPRGFVLANYATMGPRKHRVEVERNLIVVVHRDAAPSALSGAKKPVNATADPGLTSFLTAERNEWLTSHELLVSSSDSALAAAILSGDKAAWRRWSETAEKRERTGNFWIQIDLGKSSAVSLSGFSIMRTGKISKSDWKVLGSPDGSKWVDIRLQSSAVPFVAGIRTATFEVDGKVMDVGGDEDGDATGSSSLSPSSQRLPIYRVIRITSDAPQSLGWVDLFGTLILLRRSDVLERKLKEKESSLKVVSMPTPTVKDVLDETEYSGILWWIGTGGGLKPYSNPTKTRGVVVDPEYFSPILGRQDYDVQLDASNITLDIGPGRTVWPKSVWLRLTAPDAILIRASILEWKVMTSLDGVSWQNLPIEVALSESTTTSFLPHQPDSNARVHYFLVEMRGRSKLLSASKITIVVPERIVGRGKVINFTAVEVYGLMQQGTSQAVVRSQVLLERAKIVREKEKDQARKLIPIQIETEGEANIALFSGTHPQPELPPKPEHSPRDAPTTSPAPQETPMKLTVDLARSMSVSAQKEIRLSTKQSPRTPAELLRTPISHTSRAEASLVSVSNPASEIKPPPPQPLELVRPSSTNFQSHRAPPPLFQPAPQVEERRLNVSGGMPTTTPFDFDRFAAERIPGYNVSPTRPTATRSPQPQSQPKQNPEELFTRRRPENQFERMQRATEITDAVSTLEAPLRGGSVGGSRVNIPGGRSATGNVVLDKYRGIINTNRYANRRFGGAMATEPRLDQDEQPQI